MKEKDKEQHTFIIVGQGVKNSNAEIIKEYLKNKSIEIAVTKPNSEGKNTSKTNFENAISELKPLEMEPKSLEKTYNQKPFWERKK